MQHRFQQTRLVSAGPQALKCGHCCCQISPSPEKEKEWDASTGFELNRFFSLTYFITFMSPLYQLIEKTNLSYNHKTSVYVGVPVAEHVSCSK